MISHIIFLIVGYAFGWLTGWIIDRRIYKIIRREKENIRDWWTYSDEAKKYK